MTVRADLVDQVQRQGLLADLQLAQVTPEPADDLVAEDYQLQRAGHGAVKVADVVDQIGPADSVGEQAQGCIQNLRPSLFLAQALLAGLLIFMLIIK